MNQIFTRRGIPFNKKNVHEPCDLVEKDQDYEITAELPGLDESDILVRYDDDNQGREKKEVAETKEENVYVSERRYVMAA